MSEKQNKAVELTDNEMEKVQGGLFYPYGLPVQKASDSVSPDPIDPKKLLGQLSPDSHEGAC